MFWTCYDLHRKTADWTAVQQTVTIKLSPLNKLSVHTVLYPGDESGKFSGRKDCDRKALKGLKSLGKICKKCTAFTGLMDSGFPLSTGSIWPAQNSSARCVAFP
ncbi:hypothetical protein CHARACLAT_023122 [Characodon lateralis]|uniref:Uncharacterized protein n=1 Tax=Characodon lateralis TaxID=208331 RepID=A0ABU7CQF4_9TELE|nr:hypothetical protein [Characodon lateralis]